MMLHVATPTYRSEVTLAYHSSMVTLAMWCEHNGIPMRVSYRNDADLPTSRDVLTKQLWDGGADACLFIDSDISFKESDVQRLLTAPAGKEAITGLYRRKSDTFSVPIGVSGFG